MLQLIGRRLLATVPLLLAVSMVVFSFVHLLPGDPAVLFLGEEATPDNLARFRAKLGFDRPLVVQYGEWLGRALQGDLGPVSYTHLTLPDERSSVDLGGR